MPEISVNVPVYNCAPYLRQTLDSVLAQTFEDWECIIVDDASTDGTADIAQEYVDRDPRFKLHRLDAATKQPYPANRNLCVTHSTGQWIAPLDGDDWWEPWKLQRQLEWIKARKEIVLCFAVGWIWADGKVRGHTDSVPDEQIRRELPVHNIACHPAVMIDRQVMLEMGGYDLAFKTAQDWDLWLRIMWRFGAERLTTFPEPCMYHRMHATNVTNALAKCSPHEWAIVRRSLRHAWWGLKNPAMAWRVLNYRLTRDAHRYRKAGLLGVALRRSLGMVLIKPIGLTRWKLLLQITRQMLQREPSGQ